MDQKVSFQAAASMGMSLSGPYVCLAKDRPREYGQFQGPYKAIEFLISSRKLSCKMEYFMSQNIMSLDEPP